MAWPTTVLLGLMVLGSSAARFQFPEEMILNAPYTAFHANGSVNVDAVPALAAQAKGYGVTTIWSCGSMSQFYAMTMAERKALNEAWVREGHAHGMYVIVHVGTTVVAEAHEMARHATEVGADAIATVPPYYSKPGSVDDLLP